MTDQQREFRGIWIAAEVWLDTRLNATEKIVLAEIDSLDGADGCYASNAYLAAFCQCSERKITEAIAKLIECGYVTVANFDGRNRVLRSRVAKSARQDSGNCEADTKNLRADNNKEKQSIIKDIPPISPTGETDVQALFAEFWEAYPRKVDKKGAERAFLRVKGIADIFQQMMDALAACKRSEQWTKDGGQYIPHPTTWIRQERWTATIEAPNEKRGSFDVDDFMAAALARTYGEEKR